MGKVPSTWSSVKVETTEASTCRRPSMVLPIDMRSATLWLPSRMSWSCPRRSAVKARALEALGMPTSCRLFAIRACHRFSVCSCRARPSSDLYHSLRMVQPDTPCQSSLREEAQLRYRELVELHRTSARPIDERRPTPQHSPLAGRDACRRLLSRQGDADLYSRSVPAEGWP